MSAFASRIRISIRVVARRGFAAFAMSVLCLFAVEACAEGTEGSVSGTGTASAERMPERMRVVFELTAKGDSLTSALAKLKEKRATTEGALALLGAEKGSIKFGEVNVQKQAETEEMNRMLMERMGRSRRATASASAGGEEKPKSEAADAVVRVTADWPLPSGDAEDLLIAVHGLQKKINDADLGGMKEKAKLSPEEEELQAEMQQMMSSSQQGPKPGQATFLFLAKIPDEERAKLLATAFAKAKASAEQTAAAAGRKLDKLVSVESAGSGGGFDSGMEGYGGYSPRAYYYAMQGRESGDLSDVIGTDEHVAVSRQPGKIKQSFTIQAKFSFAP